MKKLLTLASLGAFVLSLQGASLAQEKAAPTPATPPAVEKPVSGPEVPATPPKEEAKETKEKTSKKKKTKTKKVKGKKKKAKVEEKAE